MRQWSVWALAILAACDQSEPVPSVAPVLSQPTASSRSPAPLFDGISRYASEGVFAPFSPMRRWMRVPPVGEVNSPSVEQDPLHQLGLDAMRYVGYLQRGTQRVALLDVAGRVFSVRVGERIGVEGARVRTIGERALRFYLPLNGEGTRAVALPELRIESEKHADKRE